MKKILSILVCVCVLLSAMVLTVSAADNTVTYNSSSYDGASNTAITNTTKAMKDGILTIGAYEGASSGSAAFRSDEIRFYASSYATFTSTKDITSITFNIKGKSATTMDVSTSTDGSTWTAVKTDVSLTTSFADVTVDFSPATKYIKIHDYNKQVIVKSFTVTYVADTTGGEEPSCEHTAKSAVPNGDETHKLVCDACSETVTPAVDCTDADINGKCDVCEGNVALPEAKTIAQVLAMADGDTKFYVTAKIVDTYRDTWATYGNFILKDDSTEDTIIMYGLKDEAGNRYDAMETKPVVGDTVKVLANRSSYNGVGQLANAVLLELTPATPGEGGNEGDDTPDTPDVPTEIPVKTIAEILAMADSTDKFIVTAEIVDTYRDTWATYGNFILKDSSTDETIICYGLADEAGNRYDEMETKPVVGDTIKVQANRSSYNGVGQLANAVLLELTPATPGEGGDEGDDTPDTPVELPTPDDTNTLTITEALELGAEQATGEYAADKYYVTGQIVSITNDMYGNMYIADEDGNEILVYGTYSADGELRYDAMESKPDVGDTVTLYSVVGNHNDTPQLKNAWIIEFTEGELDVETPAEPEADSVLSITEALELGLTKRHNEYTADKYYITGKVVEYSTNYETYGNMFIEDAEGNRILVYGMYSEDGEIRYDELEDKPEIGDTITVYGVIGQYNGTPQMKNGWLKAAPATDDGENDTTGGTTGDNTTGGTTGGTTTDTNTGSGTTTDTTSPVTGDTVGSCVAMAIAAAAVVLYTSKKR